MITHVKFVGIPTRDQDRALTFYTEKLGFKVATEQPLDDKQRWIELKLPRAETRVTLFTPQGQEDLVGRQWNGALACENVQETYEILRAAGVVFEQAPQAQPWGKFMVVKDPDGNRLVLSSK